MTYLHSQRVTRADVAKEAGTSVAVVSYVINHGPRPVAEATRQRVLQAIKKTGYRPNGIARALASGSTQTYGLIVPDITNPFIASMARALQREAFADGKILLLGDAGDSSGRERELINNMLHRQVDGLIYTSVDRHPYIDLIHENATPCVMLDHLAGRLDVSVIQVDEELAARQVTQHLIDHGYRDIGIICGPRDMLNTQDRIRGWQLALEASSLTINPSWIFSTGYTRAGGYEATKRLLQGPLPRALFASNEQQALGCLRALAEQGLRVPQDMALVCFNATQESAYNVPSLTAVRQPVDQMARAAISMLKNWNGEARRIEFAFFLQIGESCGCQHHENLLETR
ncbi:LacI family DNA-binding transcriptional regulator [Edwardsiella hoshinae]|uniref:Catabolite control protein n=1 Tax=Edwardsiella hoshinae TaxID=93378 RepID=A0A376DJ50_9GAMM|nr:LacI family DNA-binding transcriptional regulator [Edwardsiella hoshinae]QPR29518.1 LacI family DNA-binding transcriptional regulator [Edwardsiella hoshinae]STC90247.1 Catabolite control protein [Edwardsiella hoshinae]